jgi:hypothetical protein
VVSWPSRIASRPPGCSSSCARAIAWPGIQYSFSPQREAPLGPGRLARMTLVSTELTITMTGITDLDLLAFARGVVDELPGDVRVVALSLERRSEASPDLLARLRAGEPAGLVDGRLQLEWRAVRWQSGTGAPQDSS